MRQLTDLEQAEDLAKVMVELTSAFEGIASTRISQIKDQVLKSTAFFGDLWQIYSQIRFDKTFRFGRSQSQVAVMPKELLILVTSEGSFSGDIDQKLVTQALSRYNTENNELIVIGHHGLVQLTQNNVPVVKSFKMPINDKNINVMPLIVEVQKYKATTVYYPSYVSLMNQQINTISLSSAVAAKGANVRPGEEIISEQNYIFEPSTYAVVDHLERSMMQIMLSELIMESKLAQYASRFRSMRVAHEKAEDSKKEVTWQHNRAKRQLKDERLKEIVNGLRGRARQ